MIDAALKVKYRKCEQLVPFEGNARTHSEKQIGLIATNIERFGWSNPILVDEDSQIIAGHGRLLAARRLALAEVPTIELRGLNREEKIALNVSDNQLALTAGWSAELLRVQLEQLKPFDIDAALLGFSARELQNIVGSNAVQQAQPPVYDSEQICEAAFEHYRALGFPYPSLTLHESMQEINALRAMATDDLLNTTRAYQVPDRFQRHRFEGKIEGKKTPLEGFADDKILRRILAFAQKHKELGSDYFGELNIMSGVQTCANFRPGFAAYIYRRFCERGGRVLDTSTGYGGRLVGAIGSGVVAEYVGIDPSERTVAGNCEMLLRLGRPIVAQMIHKPAEDVTLDEIGAPCDFAFTSPPYFSKEHYSEEATQSWRRYPSGEAWRDGFLRAMLSLQFAALKSGALSLVNIEDVTIKDVRYPLVDWTRAAGIEVGFAFERMEQFPLPASNWVQEDGVDRFEHVLVFRKP